MFFETFDLQYLNYTDNPDCEESFEPLEISSELDDFLRHIEYAKRALNMMLSHGEF